jgi:predicted ATPase/DNA-binding XRE family transcriptional regulator
MESPSFDFAALLRRFRRERGLTQERLAADAQLSVGSISYLERGLSLVPHRDTIDLLERALRLTPGEAALFAEAARSGRSTGAATAPPTLPPPHSGRLTPPLTPLIGREREEVEAIHLLTLSSVRLLTLTGAAGVGKTRLAFQIAAALRDASHFDVYYVSLITVREVERVLPAIAEVFGVQDSGAVALRDALVMALGDRPLLLVLDNFEQVALAARDIVDLLGAVPHAKALVTSRSSLHVRGEHEFVVPPLALPPPASSFSSDELEGYAATALFLERSRAVRHDVSMDSAEQRLLVATICALLDGLPLGIELAAARVKHLPLRVLYERLTGPAPLAVLAGGASDLPDHQHTMRAAIEWSYNLLRPDEQQLFRALSVFERGATLEALAAVAGSDEDAVLEGVTSLGDKSLVRWSDTPTGQRYTQLVLLRTFGREQAREASEYDHLRRRHAEYYAQLLDLADVGIQHADAGVLERLTAELDNLRAALRWALPAGQTLTGLRILGILWPFWSTRGHFIEGLDWSERFLEAAGPPQVAEEQLAQSRTWTGVLVLSYRLNRFESAVTAGEQALALRRLLGDQLQVGIALMNLGNALLEVRAFDRAEAAYRECLPLFQAMRDSEEGQDSLIKSLLNLGKLKRDMGAYDESLALYEQSLALSRTNFVEDEALAILLLDIGDVLTLLAQPSRAEASLHESLAVFQRIGATWGIAECEYDLGFAAWAAGDLLGAQGHFEVSGALRRELGNHDGLARALYGLGSVLLEQDEAPRAAAALREALDLFVLTRNTQQIWWSIERCGTLACARGAFDLAARLYHAGATGRVRGDPLYAMECEIRARDQERLRAALGDAAFAAARIASEQISSETAIALAREAL